MRQELWKRLSIRACALIFMGGMCGLSEHANAQGYGYQQGYEQGYRDGADTRERDWRRDDGRITILGARYGSRERACDATEALRRMIGWRPGAEFIVNNNLCGDPAYGRVKRLYVEYRCGYGEIRRIEGRENEIISMYCRR